MFSERIKKLLHDELDVMLARDNGPNPNDEIRLSLSQYNAASGAEHVSIIDTTHFNMTHHAILSRFVKKFRIRPEEGP